MTSLRNDEPQSTFSTGGSALARASRSGLPVNAVARRLGVAPATLRTWDRRYGLGASEHLAGSHRRYNDNDVTRLIIMRRLALDGVAPVDAARAARETDLASVDRAELEDDLSRMLAQQADTAGPIAPSGARQPGDAGAESRTAQSGARVLRIATMTQQAPRSPSAVVEAVLGRDLESCRAQLQLQADDDPASWWETLLAPALESLAYRTVLAGPGEAPELMLLDVAMASIASYVAALQERAARRGRPLSHPSRAGNMVLVFLPPGDAHPLPAHVLAAALAGHDVPTRIVTGPANEHRVLEIIMMVRPVATVMVTALRHPDLGLVRAINEANPTMPQFVGLEHDDAVAELPVAANVHRTRSFSGLLHEVVAVAEHHRTS